jgi:hypothetical protein
MVQVIKSNPSFGTLLAQHLGQAGADLGQGYLQGQQNKKRQSGVSTLLQQFGITPEQAQQIAMTGIEAKDVLAHGQNLNKSGQLSKESQEKKETAENLLGTIGEMESLLPYVGSTSVPFTKSFNAVPAGLNREGLERRSEFDTLAAQIAGFFRDLETKGQLPQGLYEKVIEPRLPSSKLSERENIGRLKAVKSLAERHGRIKAPESKKDNTQKERPPLESFYK